MIHLIYCRDEDNVIGIHGDLAIRFKEDLKRFKEITSFSYTEKQNIVVMGYNTWVSLGKKPLSNRHNIVITKNHYLEFSLGQAFVSLDNFFEWYEQNKSQWGYVFMIGGASIYYECMVNHECKIAKIYETLVLGSHVNSKQAIRFKPDHSQFETIECQQSQAAGLIKDSGLGDWIHKQIEYKFITLQNMRTVNTEEQEYLHCMKHILTQPEIPSRNGPVKSQFGLKLTFDLRNGFPLLTTKRMGWKTILRELIWFIQGSTNNQDLLDNKVSIWTQNAEEYVTRSEYKLGDLGPIYGFQWRHFGARYNGCDSSYEGQGFDQLQWIIDEIKRNPQSRRLVLSAWNPVDIPNMALPPCHVMVQFFINKEYIDAQMYQRSGDMFLGVPFNISSYSFLLHIVGALTGYKPRMFHHILGDAHIYQSHVDAVTMQIHRYPVKFPTLTMQPIESLDDITEDKFTIEGYMCQDRIKAPMIT